MDLKPPEGEGDSDGEVTSPETFNPPTLLACTHSEWEEQEELEADYSQRDDSREEYDEEHEDGDNEEGGEDDDVS